MPKEKDISEDNRDKKVEGRAKRRRYVQGTRAYTHAIANSIAKRAATKEDVGDESAGKADAGGNPL
jgi:hypothetical protein